MTERLALGAAAVVCAALLFVGLDKPALWQDEAETALLAESVLEHSYPSVRLGDRLISGQPTLRAYESDAGGAWIWNTWLPYYAGAAGLGLGGRTPRAARLPFALFGFASFLLALYVFRGLSPRAPASAVAAAWCLALSVPWLLLMRQCRYYSLACFGTLAAVAAYRLLLKGRRWGAPALTASLCFLVNTFFVLGAVTGAALAADAVLRKEDRRFRRLFWGALGAALALSLPVAVCFKVWSRHGIHDYGVAESIQFLKTFFLWLHQFVLAGPFLAAGLLLRFRPRAGAAARLLSGWKGPALAAALYALSLLALVGEGPLSLAGTALLFGALGVSACLVPAAPGELSPRLPLLLSFFTLTVFAFKGAEPYGRYLAALLPFAAWALGAAVVELSGGRTGAAVLLGAACLSSNLFFVLPTRLLAGPAAAPIDTVSGMMRERLRDVPLRSDLLSFLGELRRGASGYVEPVSELLKREAAPGDRAFSDSDNLSFMFSTGLRFLTPEELETERPEWLLPSPWLRFSPAALARVRTLLASGAYKEIEVPAPRTLWQDNPDVLFHSFSPTAGSRTVYRRM